MIPLTLEEIARITGGRPAGDPGLVVTGPATVDSRRIEAGGLFVAVDGEHVDGHDFARQAVEAGAVATLATREVLGPHILVHDVVDALARLTDVVVSRLQRDCDLHVIGVTGSQGKTGTKDLLAQILWHEGPVIAPVGSFNNDLGVPLTALRAEPGTRYLIIEMGARGAGHIARLCDMTHPRTGIVLNVGDAHASEFGSREETARAKGELPGALPPGGVAVLNADDDVVTAMRTPARIVTFGENADVSMEDVESRGDGSTRFTLRHGDDSVRVDLPLLGVHTASNATAAAAAALSLGVGLTAIAEALGKARELSPMRMAPTRRDDGLVVVNDAYNANPESMAAALTTLASMRTEGRRIAVLGEMLELGDASIDRHETVGRLARSLDIHVIAVGDGGAAIAEGAGAGAVRVDDVESAVSAVLDRVTADDVVLVKASRSIGLERVAARLIEPTRHTS